LVIMLLFFNIFEVSKGKVIVFNSGNFDNTITKLVFFLLNCLKYKILDNILLMNKINLYIFSQIVKSCTLVFFIFVSIAWLMQISRLFSIMNNLNIQFFDIFSLSLWLIPNLTNITLPFIMIFGLVLAFLKFERDKEIIAIYSLGLSTSEIKKPIIFLFTNKLTISL